MKSEAVKLFLNLLFPAILMFLAYKAFSWTGVFIVFAIIFIPLMWILVMIASRRLTRIDKFIKAHPEFKDELK